MRVSVVTPTHNKLPLLTRTLRTLAAQVFDPADLEAVVVDDGSTDGTAEFLAAHRPPFRLVPVRLDENRGRAAARNRGVDRAVGELVVFLDDDMELDPGFLRAHVAFHEANPGAVGVGNVVNHPEIVMAPIDRYMSTRGAQKIRNRGPLPWRYFSTNNASVRRADLAAVGGFDEGFTTYGFEDLELAYRLERERGTRFGFVEDARSLHIHAHTLDEVLAKKTLCGRASLRHLFAKHPETRRLLGFHRWDPPRAGDPWRLNAMRVVLRAFFRAPVYRLVKPLARMPLGGLTDRAIDYLVMYHYLQGLNEP